MNIIKIVELAGEESLRHTIWASSELVLAFTTLKRQFGEAVFIIVELEDRIKKLEEKYTPNAPLYDPKDVRIKFKKKKKV